MFDFILVPEMSEVAELRCFWNLTVRVGGIEEKLIKGWVNLKIWYVKVNMKVRRAEMGEDVRRWWNGGESGVNLRGSFRSWWGCVWIKVRNQKLF